jgi:hypothetical protein
MKTFRSSEIRREGSRLALMGWFLAVLAGCGQGDAPTTTPVLKPAPTIIQALGNYSLNGGSDVLSISTAPAGALGYQLGDSDDFDRHGLGLISDATRPWFFHNAVDGSVWCYVDGFGTVRWTYDPGTGWESTLFDDLSDDVKNDIPTPFRDRLPEDGLGS